MADLKHLRQLHRKVSEWNRWRSKNPDIIPDLSGADLTKKNLHGANLSEANLQGTNFFDANLAGANLNLADASKAIFDRANLKDAQLVQANLAKASLKKARLTGVNAERVWMPLADLSQADLTNAVLDRANLRKTKMVEVTGFRTSFKNADLTRSFLRRASMDEADMENASLEKCRLASSSLVRTNLEGATLLNCHIYGIAVWDLKGRPRDQRNLVITPPDVPSITVDDLEVAQFIYLLASNDKIRQVVDTLTSKVVLILGRFTPERKCVLDAMREALRDRDFLPVLFDCQAPSRQSAMETVSLLARMARFVIADLTDAKSVLQELQAIVPDSPTLPVQTLIHEAHSMPGMIGNLKRYPWVLPTYEYDSTESLLGVIEEEIISPVEQKWEELEAEG